MVRSNAVWGIDVGNCSLKAMRCYVEDKDPSKLIADAIDYIEYPMILTQSGANAEELIQDALKEFLSRNNIRNDKIAISIAGQNGLVRFIKLPPIDPKKIPDIVRYEAKQQIPFDLNEVIWDYQRLGRADDNSGFPLEVEIGLFAMKRDQVFHILEPYEDVDIPVDYVQLAPLALYNYMMVDELRDLPSVDEYDPENPPPYVVVVSMGTDATDLILTNGFRVWQRNLPIGGSHFTKALMKELKLTFAKADHLKRNLTTSQDKVAVLKAMQPVFNNFQNEIQRSLGYHSSLDPNAQYDRVIALGSAMKLTGLTKYLSQNLGIRVDLGTSFAGLNTSLLADSTIVKENLPSYGICYGLCLQGVKRATVRTNLLPNEIRTARIINSKKPWAVAAISLMMLGAAVSFGAHVGIQASVDSKSWQSVESAAGGLTSIATECQTKVSELEEGMASVNKIGKNLIGNVEKRLLWLELMRGINECLPVPPPQDPRENPTSESIRNREELHIMNIEAQPLDDYETGQWLEKMLKEKWLQMPKELVSTEESSEGEGAEETELSSDELFVKFFASSEEDGSEEMGSADGEEGAENAPKRWLISVSGYHFHNGLSLEVERADFVRNTFIRNLEEKTFQIPKAVPLSLLAGTEASLEGEGEQTPSPLETTSVALVGDGEETVTMAELGVCYPVLVNPGNSVRTTIQNPYLLPDPNTLNASGMNSGRPGGRLLETENALTLEEQGKIEVDRFDFTVHFIWEPKVPTERERIRKAKEEAQRLAAEETAAMEDSEEESEE